MNKSKGKKRIGSSRYHRGPLFGSGEFKAAYWDRRWERGGKGICGPAAVAIATGVSDGPGFAKILKRWHGGFKGSALVRDMERELRARHVVSKRMRIKGTGSKLELPDGVNSALVFIKWGTAKHWLFLERIEGKLRGACSEYGWFNQGDRAFKNYLKPSDAEENRILSYLVLKT